MRIAGFMLTTRLVIIGILNDLTACLCSQPKQKSIRIARGCSMGFGCGTWDLEWNSDFESDSGHSPENWLNIIYEPTARHIT